MGGGGAGGASGGGKTRLRHPRLCCGVRWVQSVKKMGRPPSVPRHWESHWSQDYAWGEVEGGGARGIIHTTCGAKESSKAITVNNGRNQLGSTPRRWCMLTSCHDDRCGLLCVVVV